nr:uncharacterized protein LOC116839657 [Chelonoidis abingdonii]
MTSEEAGNRAVAGAERAPERKRQRAAAVARESGANHQLQSRDEGPRPHDLLHHVRLQGPVPRAGAGCLSKGFEHSQEKPALPPPQCWLRFPSRQIVTDKLFGLIRLPSALWDSTIALELEFLVLINLRREIREAPGIDVIACGLDSSLLISVEAGRLDGGCRVESAAVGRGVPSWRSLTTCHHEAWWLISFEAGTPTACLVLTSAASEMPVSGSSILQPAMPLTDLPTSRYCKYLW